MSRYVMEDAPEDRYVMEDAAVTAGRGLNDIPRQIGLTARYGLEGLANAAQIGTEPIRYLTDRLTGQTGNTKPLGALASQFADYIGLPQPQGANERVIGDATRLMAGAGGMGAMAGAPVQIGRTVSQLIPQTSLANNMGSQIASAAGAGLAGGASREAGGSPLMQAGAALVGGVAGGLAPGSVNSTVTAAKSLFNRMTPQQLDTQISAVLNRAGVDYSQIPERARQSMRAEMASALQAGKELDPAAVARLADFARVGAIPTRGMVSQNPVQITREMNLAKIGANSSDESLQGLPLIQNRNNATLIQNLNDAGASKGDPFRAGQAAIGSIAAKDAEMGANVKGLYDTARGMAGGDIPIDRKPVIDGVFETLAKSGKMGFLPEGISKRLNEISGGVVKVNGQEFPVPFTAQTIDELKTMLATAQRGTQDGNAKAALSAVREALDKAPVNVAQTGSSLPASMGQASAIGGAQTASGDFLGALDKARAAAAQRFGWQESSKPVEAALNGAQPDKFVQQFVIGGSLDDAKAIAKNAPVDEVKNAILAHLKDRALGGASDEIGKFSQSAFNRALNQIGDRKMALFFSPEEIANIKSQARVASYMQNQPVGSAVNNSNSGALLIGKGYDALKGVAGKMPFGQSLVLDPIKNIEISMRNRQAQNVLPGLLAPQMRQPMGQGLLLPGLAYGGLLAAPTSP